MNAELCIAVSSSNENSIRLVLQTHPHLK